MQRRLSRLCALLSGSAEGCYEMMTMQHTRDRVKVQISASPWVLFELFTFCHCGANLFFTSLIVYLCD